MNIIRKGITILRRQGVSEFIKRTYNYLIWKMNMYYLSIIAQRSLIRGELKLSIGETNIRMSAENIESTKGNLIRFKNEFNRLEQMINELNESDVFFDIGANTGLYTCFASKNCKEVVAFEPYPPNIYELQKNIQNNNNNISIFEAALSDKTGDASFNIESEEDSNYPGADSPGFGSGSISLEGGNLEVPTIRGDDLIEQGEIPKPNVVKIDVEGSEPLVIQGLRNGLSDRSCRVVFCEVHRHKPSRGSIHDHGMDESDMIQLFEELGFDNITKFDDGGSEFVIRAHRS